MYNSLGRMFRLNSPILQPVVASDARNVIPLENVEQTGVPKTEKRGSRLASYSLTEDKKCDCRSALIGPFKLLRSHKMIDAHIPHLHRKSGNRSCLAAPRFPVVDEKIFPRSPHRGTRTCARTHTYIYISSRSPPHIYGVSFFLSFLFSRVTSRSYLFVCI